MINYYKSLLLFISGIFLFINSADAQNKPSKTEIKGIVKNKTGEALAGSSVWLCTPTDTLKTSTDENGAFHIKGIILGKTTLLVRSLGFESITKAINPNENKTTDVGTINLTGATKTLKEVVIYGKVGIKYKKDTVEYNAGDYNIPKYSRVEDLMKKMEGLQVDRDGNVVYNGKKVEQVNLNGVTYFGGKQISNAIRELPADIVNKIQLVDDIGEDTRITGIINIKPKKVLNIVTKANKSAGKLFDISAESNIDDRYTGNAGLRRIDGEEQLGAKGAFMKAPIIGPNLAGSTGGSIKNGSGDLFYNNKLGKKVTLQGNYNYAFSDNHIIGNTTAQEFFGGKELNTVSSKENSAQDKNHTGFVNLTYSNTRDNQIIEQLYINSSITYSPSETQFNSSIAQKGTVNQDQLIDNFSKANALNYNLSATYSHRLNNKGKNIFLSVEARGNNTTNEEKNGSIFKFLDETTKDSTLNRLTKTKSINHSYNTYIDYNLPIGKTSTIGFIGSLSLSSSQNNQNIFNTDIPGKQQLIDSLSRPFDFRNTNIPIGIRYQYNKDKLGLAASIQGFFSNVYANLYNRGKNISRNTFNITPDIKLYYHPNNTFQIISYYTGTVTQPSIDQLQEVPIVSNPANIIYGNPSLKPIYTNTLSIQLSNTFPASNINVNVNINANVVSNKVVQNIILIVDPIAGTYRETRYANLNGEYMLGADYSVYKAFPENKYTIAYSGNINKSNTLSLIDNVKNPTRNLAIGQRLNIGIIPSTWFESNFGTSFTRTTSHFERDLFNYILTNNWAFDLNTKFSYPKQYAFLNITFVKNFVNGVNANLNNNPFLINASISKRFPKQQLVLGFRVFDLLKQNDPVNRQITSVGIIESRSNPNSRYFMLSANWTPQMWTPGKKAKANKVRKNDGSYID